LAAFCIGWLAEVESELHGQIEPVGVLPADQKMGLGRAILHEGLRRMQAAGATTALIEAESNNPASQHLYRSAGFETVYKTLKYFKEFKPT
jgi:mycothiol synthase